MNPSAFSNTIFLLCTVITSLHCVPAIETAIDHVHNVIEKDEHIKTPTVEHSKISTLEKLENPIKTTIKTTVPLVHDKKLTIRHPLPPSWHDILPHEAPRYNKVDQDKVHQEFLLHEGPKLQRRLHHHFTVEELRQRRKELREKLQARYNKLTQITSSTTENVLKLTPPILPNSTHSVVRKTLETTTPQPTTTTIESNDINTTIQSKIPITTPEFTTPTLIAITTPQTELPFVGLLPKMRKILGHVETSTEPMETTTKPNLLTLLRGKHRFSALKKDDTTMTTSIPDVTTLKPTSRPKIRQLLGTRRNVPTTTEMIVTSTEKDEVVSKRIVVSNADKTPLIRLRMAQTVTTDIPEITTVPDEESGKYEDWRQHLREAIKRRLQKFRRHSGEE